MAPTPAGTATGRWDILASAIAGVSMSVTSSRETLARIDGRTLSLPEALRDSDKEVTIAVQSALWALGSRWELEHLPRRVATLRRFVMLETSRAVETLGWVLPSMVWRELRQACLAIRSPGNAAESAERAVGDRSVPLAPDRFGTLVRARGDDGPRSVEVTESAVEVVRGDEASTDDGSDRSSAILSWLSSPFGRDKTANRRGARDRESAGEPRQARSQVRLGANDSGRHASVATAPAAVQVAVSGGRRGHRYPEWDERRQRYRPEWCTVVEYDTVPADDRSDRPSGDRALLRQLARLGLLLERHDRLADGADLDLARLVEFAVDRSSGFMVDDRIFSSRRSTGRDLSVLVLVDASGSTTDERGLDDSVWSRQRVLADGLVRAFSALGDRVSAYAFSSNGRHRVQFLRLLSFESTATDQMRDRLDTINPRDFTRMGAALRHATHRLVSDAGTAHRLLVLISDGYAFDHGYEHGDAAADTRRALAEAAAANVATVCISVDGAARGFDARLAWDGSSHLAVSGVDEVPRQIVPLVTAALRTAERTSR